MWARSTTFRHESAGTFQTPLLVPSFSSKGFVLPKRQGAKEGDRAEHYSSARCELEEFGKFRTKSVLVSAYDLYFQHFDTSRDEPYSALDNTKNSALVFLDSGGYELTKDYDSAEIRRTPYQPKPDYWANEYKIVLADVVAEDATIPLVIANADYDTKHTSLDNQVKMARELFREFSISSTNFIIKPDTPDGSVVKPERFGPHDYDLLRRFDIIGIVEKELGVNLQKRLQRVMALRKGMDDAGIDAPIHLWGGLDPVMTPLYFFAGAEIFDGISWLRYAFKHGMAINRECGVILDKEYGVATPADIAQRMISMRNIRALDNLADNLRQWISCGGSHFDMFDEHIRCYLDKAYRTMQAWGSNANGGE